jgi:high-affinity nickel permease
VIASRIGGIGAKTFAIAEKTVATKVMSVAFVIGVRTAATAERIAGIDARIGAIASVNADQ